MSHLPVLIVGAGPTGLMVACELARRNIPFRIIDKKSEPSKGSNATWIQSRTLEIFDYLGMADPFLRKGHPCHAINFYQNGNQIGNLNLKQIDSCYPFILMLPQSETEKILAEKLAKSNIKVERSIELINLEKHKNNFVSTIRMPNGNLENISSDWVIACDGANSTVRQKCGIHFPGVDIPEQFMVGDAKMSSFLSTHEIHVFFDKGTIFPDKATMFAAFPWGEKEYRLNANLYLESPRQNFTEQEVRELVAERANGNYTVESVSWISPFWIHSKTVKDMQEDRIFLAGDAAHIHSPAGGQGMNTGLQDAFNLAWKLALHIQHKADRSLLDSYQLERFPVVNRIVTQSDYLTNMMLFDKTFFAKLRKFSKSISQPKQAKKIGMQLTQLAIRYQKSPIIDYHEKTPVNSPKQGERAPNVKMTASQHLYDYLRNTGYNILLFSGLNADEKSLTKLIQLQKQLQEKFPEVIKTHIIGTVEKNSEHFIFDTNQQIHQTYNIKKPAIYIIRPDNYIAYFSKKMDEKPIKNFLKTNLI